MRLLILFSILLTLGGCSGDEKSIDITRDIGIKLDALGVTVKNKSFDTFSEINFTINDEFEAKITNLKDGEMRYITYADFADKRGERFLFSRKVMELSIYAEKETGEYGGASFTPKN